MLELGLLFLGLGGGAAYAIKKRNEYLRWPDTRRWLNPPSGSHPQPLAVVEVRNPISLEEKIVRRADRQVVLASVSLGMAVVGVLLVPLLGLLSLPLALYLTAPIFRSGFETVRQERRLTPDAVSALRIGVCVTAGFTIAAALDAFFYQITQRMIAQTNRDYRQSLRRIFGDDAPPLWLEIEQPPMWEREQQAMPVQALYAEAVEVDNVHTDDVLLIASGETIPVDGQVAGGYGWVREFVATGGNAPVEKRPGDPITAASRLITGQLSVRVESAATRFTGAEAHAALEQTVAQSTLLHEIGESSARSGAPIMALTWLATIPFYGLNRATSFLCTGLGVHMRTLGPLALQNFLLLAADQQILIKDSRGLEKAFLTNTLVLDASAFEPQILQSEEQLDRLHQTLEKLRDRQKFLQPLKIYLMTDGSEATAKRLASSLGCDDYFVRATTQAKAEALEGLQAGGRVICFVGDGVRDGAAMEQAFLSVSLCKAATVTQDTAQVILASGDPNTLEPFYALADRFFAKERINLFAPLVFDLIDIGTTLFVHLGVTYSVIFNYSGWFVGAIHSRLPLLRHRWAEQAEQDSHSLS